METSDLDLPLLPSAEQIRRREFASVRRGYDPEQVRDYLFQVAAQVETLEREMRGDDDQLPAQPPGRALAEIADVPDGGDSSENPYERVARRFAVVFETADAEAEEILGKARDEATRVLTEARAEADRVRVDAQARAEEARQEGRDALERAKQEAEETLGELRTRRASLVSQLDGMRSTLLAVADDLQLKVDDAVEAQEADASEDQAYASEEEAEGLSADASSVPAAASDTEPAKAETDEDDVWLFDDAMDIPELELTDPDPDEGTRA
jgi:DivIVA domain-containing protein